MMKYNVTLCLCSLFISVSYAQSTFQTRYQYEGQSIRILDIEGFDDGTLVVGHSIDTSVFFAANELKIFTVDENGQAVDAINIILSEIEENYILDCNLLRVSPTQYIVGCTSNHFNDITSEYNIHLISVNTSTGEYKSYNDSLFTYTLENIIIKENTDVIEWRSEKNNSAQRDALLYKYDQFLNPKFSLAYTINGADLNVPLAAVAINSGSVAAFHHGYVNIDPIGLNNSSGAPAIMKLDEMGNVLLSYSYEGPRISALALDNDGNFFASCYDGTIIKFDPNLNIIWSIKIANLSKTLSGINLSRTYVDNQNNLVFTGPNDNSANLQGNRIMKVDTDGNLILQKVMLDLAQRFTVGVTSMNNHILSFGELNQTQDLGYYIRSIDENGEADDCQSIPMCYDTYPVEINLTPVPVEVKQIANLELDEVQNVTPISLDTIHICTPTTPPNANFEVLDSILCFGEEIEIMDTSINQMGNSIWTVPEFLYTDTTKTPSNILLNNEGNFYLKHRLIFAGCEYVDSILIDIEDDEILVALDDTVCNDESLLIDLSSFQYQNILWDDGDTSFVKYLSEDREYTYEYTTPRGCNSIDHFILTREISPQSDIDQSLIKCSDAQIVLYSENMITPTWSNGLIQDAITVSNAGNYIATYSNYCGEATQLFSVAEESCALGPLANIFSPNDDGSNDLFEYSSAGIKILESTIYDRWGNPVHTYKGLAIWDGNVSGRKAIPGVYTYFIKYKKENELTSSVLTGDITVVR